LSAIVGIYSWRYLTLPFKLIFFQIICASFADITGRILEIYLNNNIFLYNAYLFIELWLVGLAGWYMIRNKTYQKWLMAFLIICTVVAIVSISITGIKVFANWAFLMECLLLTITYLGILINLLISNKGNITKEPVFWLCIGIITYFGCNVPLFGMLNYLVEYHPLLGNYIYRIDHVLCIIRYSFVAVGFLSCRKHIFTSKLITNYERP